MQQAIFDTIYPVGSIYISVGSELPSTFKGTWEKLATGRSLWNVTDNSQLGQSLEGIFPKHSHGYLAPKSTKNEDCYTNQKYSDYLAAENATTSSTTVASTVTGVTVGNEFRTPSVGVSMWKRVI